MAPVDDIDQIQQRFASFVETTRRRAPLYAMLAGRIAAEPERARVLLSAPRHQRMPVLFFAAIHMSLMADPDHRLSAHYASLGGRTPNDRDRHDLAWTSFIDLLDRRSEQLEATIAERQVQTNEVGRCAVLRAALATLPVDRPIRLVDLGAAAGLNLALDRYRIEYTDVGETGAADDLTIACEVRSGTPPPTGPIATITDRIGLDASPIDLARAEDRQWLRACVWADETERLSRLDRAIAVARREPITIERHDLRDGPFATLQRVIDDQLDTTAVVMNSWVLAYLDDIEQQRVIDALDALGRHTGRLVWVCFESVESVPGLAQLTPGMNRSDPASVLVMSDWASGTRSSRLLARCHPHGHWIEWFDPAGAEHGARQLGEVTRSRQFH